MKNEISTLVKVRFSDCDPLGHLNNVKYLEYMMNAREDHIENFYGFTYEEYTRQTGFAWVAVQNEIAYLKEVKHNEKVIISSKNIELTDRISKVEVQMKTQDEQTILAALWITAVYFNVKTRKSEIIPEQEKQKFLPFLVEIEQKNFQERVNFLRKQNKK